MLNLGYPQPISGGGGSTPSYRVDYNKTKYEKLLETPLTFEITSDGSIYWRCRVSLFRTIEYRKNYGSWTTIKSVVTPNIQSPNIDVVTGDIVEFRGNNLSYGVITGTTYNTYDWNSFSGSTCGFKVKGNIMSLVNKENFKDLKTLDEDATFPRLFTLCTGLTDASDLLLPSTVMTKSCYRNLFSDCTNLVKIPVLPAEKMEHSCYSAMFARCISLTTAPELHATTLAHGCYNGMFKETLLQQAPELPATTLASRCYYQMFQNCGSLTYIKCLATDISATECTKDWVNGVAASGTFVKAADATWINGENGIPNNWIVQDASNL